MTTALAGLLTLISICSPQHPADGAARIEAWTKSLRDAVGVEAKSVIFEVILESHPIDFSKCPLQGVERMRTIANITGTRWTQMAGAQVFHRRPSAGERAVRRET